MYVDAWSLGLMMVATFVAGALTATACLVWAAFKVANYQAAARKKKESAGVP